MSYEEASRLALSIARCPEVPDAASSKSHPCNKVVAAQLKIRSSDEVHLPEPWFGGLTTAKVMVLSSNPGLNSDEGPKAEMFPTSAWDSDRISDFFVNRLTSAAGPYVSFGMESEPNFLTLCNDGQYRSAMKNPKTPQTTWVSIHNRMKVLLGDEILPSRDYVVTELVHCKSSGAEGVRQAAENCASRWLDQISELCPAPVVISLGAHVRDYFKKSSNDFPSDFGSAQEYAAKDKQDLALRDIVLHRLGGRTRLVVMNFHNGAGVRQGLADIYGERIVRWLGQVARGEVSVPHTSQHLRETVLELLAE